MYIYIYTYVGKPCMFHEIHGAFRSHRGTHSYHPFIDGIFPYKPSSYGVSSMTLETNRNFPGEILPGAPATPRLCTTCSSGISFGFYEIPSNPPVICCSLLLKMTISFVDLWKAVDFPHPCEFARGYLKYGMTISEDYSSHLSLPDLWDSGIPKSISNLQANYG